MIINVSNLYHKLAKKRRNDGKISLLYTVKQIDLEYKATLEFKDRQIRDLKKQLELKEKTGGVIFPF